MRRNAVLTTVMIAAGTIGCQSAGAPKMPQLSWWKKTPPAEATASPSTGTPQLPSAGASPGVTIPGTPSTATYPEQAASATTAYPATPYPATAAPAGYANPAAATPSYSAPNYSANPATTGGTLPATGASAMAPQNGPYSPVYNSAAAVPPGAATATYPSMNYSSPRLSGGAESTGAPAGVVNNAYTDPPSAAPYPNTSGGTADATAGSPVGDRYASRPEVQNSSSTPSPDGSYGRPPAATSISGDRYSSPAAGDRYVNPNASPAADASTDRFARENYTPGAYQPGNTGYEAGNTGYNPPGVDPYKPPTAGNNYTTTPRRDPGYRPGGTSDYRPSDGTRPAPATGAPTERYATPPSNVRPAAYDAGPNAPPASYPSSPTGDRYGTAPASRY